MSNKNYKDKKEKGTIISIVPVIESPGTVLLTTKIFDYNGEEIDPRVQTIHGGHLDKKLSSIQKMIDMLEVEKENLEELRNDITLACEL